MIACLLVGWILGIISVFVFVAIERARMDIL